MIRKAIRSTRKTSHFDVMVKPIGAICNLDCAYCYYLEKEHLYPEGETFPMPREILEEYIVQHIDASPETVIRFSWRGFLFLCADFNSFLPKTCLTKSG